MRQLKGTTTEDIDFPQGLSFLRNNNISIALVMFVCYFIVAAIAVVRAPEAAAEIFGDQNWVVYTIVESITFSAGVYVVLAGVRLVINEIVPAFKGISEKLVPNAIPALDCPIMFNFAPNAVLIGFAASFIGGILALLVLIGMNAAGIAAAMILPGAVVHFFCGATAGVCGNATGGLKGAVVGAFVHGIVVTFLAAGLYPIMGALGFVGTTFSDADFTVVGIIFGTLCRFIGQGGLIAVAAVLFALPIVYNYTLGRKNA
jgi:PTS system ascorbate-specific IIC component